MNDIWAWSTDLHREGLILTPARLGKLLDEIEIFGSLPDNWDGEGANKIHEQTVRNCRYMARCAVDYLTVPDVDPNPNGTVSFEWCTAEGLAYLEVGRTQFSLFVETHGEVVLSLKDEISAHADSIANLFRVISGYLLPPRTISLIPCLWNHIIMNHPYDLSQVNPVLSEYAVLSFRGRAVSSRLW